MLRELEGEESRAARFRTAVALVTPDGQESVVEGAVEGVITTKRRGAGGFGYDPIFEVDGRTLAEIPTQEKNAISHRAKALYALAQALNG